jgi:hypothetical protein
MVDSNNNDKKSASFIFEIYTLETVAVYFDHPVTEDEAVKLFKENEHTETQIEAESVVANVLPFEDYLMKQLIVGEAI